MTNFHKINSTILLALAVFLDIFRDTQAVLSLLSYQLCSLDPPHSVALNRIMMCIISDLLEFQCSIYINHQTALNNQISQNIFT